MRFYQLKILGIILFSGLSLPASAQVVEVTKLPGEINTEYDEQWPLVSLDGKTIYFHRGNHPDNSGFAVMREMRRRLGSDTARFSELKGLIRDLNFEKTERGQFDFEPDIWMAEGKNFSRVKRFGAPLNNERPNHLLSISSDENLVYVVNQYRYEGTPENPVVTSYRTADGSWSEPEEVRIEGLKELSESLRTDKAIQQTLYIQASLTPDGKAMLLSVGWNSGNARLYVSSRKNDREWSRPKPLNDELNNILPRNYQPVLAADMNTLFFYGLSPDEGVFNIYYSKRKGKSLIEWTSPQKLPAPVNSSGNDLDPTPDAEGKYLYFSSDRGGNYDIYKADIQKLIAVKPVTLISGKVLHAETRKPLSAEINYFKTESDEPPANFRSSPTDGKFKLSLPAGEEYTLTASKEGFIALRELIDLKDRSKFEKKELNLLLVPIRPGERLTLNTLLFKPASDELRDVSYPELESLLESFRKNPGLKVRIEGHTDNSGKPQLLKKLSELRAERVKRFFTENGIESGRIQTVGFGGEKPRFKNSSRSEMRKNRRVEFVILEN